MSYDDVLKVVERLRPFIDNMNDTYSLKLAYMTGLVRNPLVSDNLRDILVKELIDEADWCEANLRIVEKKEMVERIWFEVEDITQED